MQQQPSTSQRTRIYSSIADSSSSYADSLSNKSLRLSPDCHFAQTDVARVICDFAACDLQALVTLRLVCRYWNELLANNDDTWALDLLKRAVQSGTLGNETNTSKVEYMFKDNMDIGYWFDDSLDEKFREEIAENGFFKNTWIMYLDPKSTYEERETVKARLRPAIYTQVEHSDLFSDLYTKDQVIYMHGAISALYNLCRFIKKESVYLVSETDFEFRPFIMKWDPSLPFTKSEILNAFKDHIGWKLDLVERKDFAKDVQEEYEKEGAEYDQEGTLRAMYTRVAYLAAFLGGDSTKLPEYPVVYANEPQSSDEDEDEDEDEPVEKQSGISLATPTYHLNYAAGRMSCFPRFYVARSADGKYILGVFGLMVWT